MKRALTPLKRQATKTALAAIQAIVSPSPSRKLLDTPRTPKLAPTPSSTSLYTPKKREVTQLWRDTAGDEIIEILSKEELKRQELIFELIYTEEQYVKDLNLIVNLFLLPINQIDSVKKEEVEMIFSGIEDVIAVNDSLLKDLKSRQSESVVVEQISDIFLDKVDTLACYGKYIGDRARADFQLSILSKNSAVAAVLKESSQKEECRRLDLSNFLDQPRRRLSKYACLLTEIDKCTPEGHPDRANLSEVVKRFSELVSDIDEQVGSMITSFQLDHFRDNLIVKEEKQKSSLSILRESTEVIHQDTLKHVKDSKELTVFLLDNCLVMTKFKPKIDLQQYKLFKNVMPLEEISVVDLAELNNGAVKNLEAVSVDALTFRVTHNDNSSITNYVFSAPSAIAKATWIRLLTRNDDQEN